MRETCSPLPCPATSIVSEAVSRHVVSYHKSLPLPAAHSLLSCLCQLLCCSSEPSVSQCTLRNAQEQPGNNWWHSCCSSESKQYSRRWAINQQPLPRRKQWPCIDHFVLYLSFLFHKWGSFRKRPAIRNGVFVLNVHQLFWSDLFLFSHVFSFL